LVRNAERTGRSLMDIGYRSAFPAGHNGLG
jgi:hypothetical protein